MSKTLINTKNISSSTNQSSINTSIPQKEDTSQIKQKINNPIDKTGIIEVYQENFIQEIINLSKLLED